ncbi:hypothetical protein [Odoribacter laneus]|uniref:hypothetical protein n=1 Tax=Odoribacter laneus TaxID=626933 RepID=UPI0011CB4B07|nr:hypothetical protein [Odoribacter laneus]
MLRPPCVLDHFAGYYLNHSESGIPADKLAAFLMQWALEYFKCGKYYRERIYYTDAQLEQWLKKSGIEGVGLNCLYPFLVRTRKWYFFLNYELLLYFAVQAIVRIENVENYSKITADIACEESKLLVFLDKADPKRFRKEILSLEIHCFLNKLNLDSSEEVVLSFIKYFNPDFSLTWLKRSNSFETAIESSGDVFVEELIRFMGIRFEVVALEDFFYKDCYREDDPVKYKKYRQGYRNLYNRLLLVFGLIDENGKLSKSTDEEFHLNLYQFAKDSENYQALKEVGMEEYILGITVKSNQNWMNIWS